MSEEKPQKNPRRRHKLLWITGVGLAVIFLLRLVLFLIPFPELDEFEEAPISSRILDRSGQLLTILPLSEGLRREHIDLESLPPYLTKIFLAAEDKRFYFHPGFDPIALVRSLIFNTQKGHTVSGASTITMQLARLVRPHSPDVGGKLSEIWDALRIEAKLSKDRILDLYLNRLPFSFQTEGIASASRFFFGKPVTDLIPEETALLALIPRRPEVYSPLKNPDLAAQKALQLVQTSGLDLTIFPRRDLTTFQAPALAAHTDLGPSLVPHFIRAFFYDPLRPPPYAKIASSSAEIRTSIDLRLQAILEASLRDHVDPYRNQRVTQAAGLVLNNHTGEILAYAGSLDFYNEADSGQIDGVQIPYQPGSTLKPFLYALALERGFLPNTILPDIPTDFGSEHIYVPMNFNRRFNGPVRLRVALASSLNVPAVYTLQRLGVRNFQDFLIGAGFHSLESQKERLGIGLALGNAEVSLWELARAFALFPRGGLSIPLTPLESTTGESHFPANSLSSQTPVQLISTTTAALIADILSDNPSRFLGFGHGQVMNTPYRAMFKTGTANQYQHVCALGATMQYTLGVWMGNFQGKTIIGRTGSGIPARALVQVLNQIVTTDEPFPKPPYTRLETIDALSGQKATPDSPSVVEEYIPDHISLEPDTFHKRMDGRIVTTYPPEYQAWLNQNRRSGIQTDAVSEEDFSILKPSDGAIFFLDPTIPLSSQTLAIETTAGKANGLRVVVDSVDRGPLGDDGLFWLPLLQGSYKVEIRASEQTLGTVHFTVR